MIKTNVRFSGICPKCRTVLPLKRSPRLKKLIELYTWYSHGYAPDHLRVQEHSNLLCAIHDMEVDYYTQKGYELNWPTKLDKQWMGGIIIKLKPHCEILMAGAPITDQFIEARDMIESGLEDAASSMPSISVYARKYGWLRSAG
jgi:hypothetical protein